MECLYLSRSTNGTEGGRERRTEKYGTMPWTSTLTLSSSAMFDYFKVLKKEADVYKKKNQRKRRRDLQSVQHLPRVQDRQYLQERPKI